MAKPPVAILPKLQPQPAELKLPVEFSGMSATVDPTASYTHSHEKAEKLAQQQAMRVRRKHVLRACDRCRAKKTKCDGKQPCNRCAAHNDPCLFRKKKTLQPRTHSRGFTEMMELKHDLLVKGLQILWMRIVQYEASLVGGPIEMVDGRPHVHGILDRLGLIKEAEDDDDSDDDDGNDVFVGSAVPWTTGHHRSVSTMGPEECAKMQQPASTLMSNCSHKRSLSAADSEELSRILYPDISRKFNTLQQQQQPHQQQAAVPNHQYDSGSIKTAESDSLSAPSLCSPPSLTNFHPSTTHELPAVQSSSSPAVPGEVGLEQQTEMPLYNTKNHQAWTTGDLGSASNFAFTTAPFMTGYAHAAAQQQQQQQQPQQTAQHPAVTQLTSELTSNDMLPSTVGAEYSHQQPMITRHQQTDSNLVDIMPDMTYPCANQGVWCSM